MEKVHKVPLQKINITKEKSSIKTNRETIDVDFVLADFTILFLFSVSAFFNFFLHLIR
jgi:hypothetical protein